MSGDVENLDELSGPIVGGGTLTDVEAADATATINGGSVTIGFGVSNGVLGYK